VQARRRRSIRFDGRVGFRPAGARASGVARAGVRLRPADLRALYPLLRPGTTVAVAP
jgi:hypothetical protein